MKAMIFSVILIFGVLFNIPPLKSQSINPIKADTVFKGYDSGVTSSVKIVNHGTSIIYNHDGKLYEMSAVTYKELRQIQLEEVNPVTKFDIDENCKYIFYQTKSDTITFVADYNSGKTLQLLNGSTHVTKDYLYFERKRDGGWSNWIYISKINDFTPIDTFRVINGGDQQHGYHLAAYQTVFDKNILLFKTHTQALGSGDWFYANDWRKVDPVTFEVGQPMLGVQCTDGYLFTSKSGKYNGFYYSSVSIDNNHYPNHVDTEILILDSAFNNIYTISENDLKAYYNDAGFSLLGDINFLNDRFLISSIKYNNGTGMVQSLMVFDIQEKKSIKFIDFENYTSACYNDKFILSNKAGCFVTLTLEQLPVLEKKKPSDNLLVQYSNNNLVIQADISKGVDISIMNITGEVIESQNCIYVNEGLNTIHLNNQLANGLYFCIIKTPEAVYSRKFLVIL